jgi:hypothetical protein
MDKFQIAFDGWITVEAENEEKAFEEAYNQLSKADLTNDGVLGEWYLSEVED